MPTSSSAMSMVALFSPGPQPSQKRVLSGSEVGPAGKDLAWKLEVP